MPTLEEVCERYGVKTRDVVYYFVLSDGSPRLIMRDDFNEVYSCLLDDDSDVQIVFGGRGSGKSSDIVKRIVAATYSGHNWLVVRYYKLDLRNSCFNEIVAVIDDWGLEKEFTIDKQTMTITCNYNKRQILFGALEEPRRLKSLKPKVGILTDIFIEEADECPNLGTFTMLQACLRGFDKDAYRRGMPQPHKRMLLAFNPILPTHWMQPYFFKPLWHHPDVRSVAQLKSLTLKDKIANGTVDGFKVTMLKTTYVDNRFLTEKDIALRENATGQRMWVDTLGNQGSLGETVFIQGEHWRIDDFDELKRKGELPEFWNIRQGADFGWVNPCAYIKCHLDTEHKKIYVFDELYIRRATTDDFAALIKDRCAGRILYCDSAEPDRINILKRYGIAAEKCKKGKAKGNKQAVTRRIDWLHDYEIIVDYHCVNLIEELRLYRWETDSEGNKLEIPVKENDHGIDALSYALGYDIFSGNYVEGVSFSFWR